MVTKTKRKVVQPRKNLVIVESPAKAKTIEKFLGRNYKVMASVGHIRDLKNLRCRLTSTITMNRVYQYSRKRSLDQ